MSAVRFRPLNRKSRAEIARVVTDYERSPLEWDPAHVIEDLRIEQSIEGLLKPDADRRNWIEVVCDESGSVLGHHWLRIEGEGEYRFATIVSLYLAPALRGRGLARRLKEHGEAWAREQGATQIKTTVHLKNPRMLALNEAMGFERGMVLMSKRLG